MTETTINRLYPLPDAATKLKIDVHTLIAALQAIDVDVTGVLTDLAGKSNVGHGHGISAISGLEDVLASKQPLGISGSLSTLTDVDVTGAAAGQVLLKWADKWIPVNLQVNNVSGLEGALSGKASGVHTHALADILGLVAALSGKAGTSHSHAQSDITGLAAALAEAVPAGAVADFARNTAPGGWLKANGAALSRSTYSALFAAIGTSFGAGNGTTTFNIPDLRGEFVRGWDDGRGVDAGRGFGSAQASQNLSHGHSGSADTAGSHGHTGLAASAGAHQHTGAPRQIGIVAGWAGVGSSASGGGIDGGNLTGSAGAHTHALTIDAAGDHTHWLTINADGGAEARPRSIALLKCIKF